jgi:hypothetical protein
MEIRSKLTLFFDEPFWVGIFEKTFEGKYEACRIVFGSEPKDYEVYDFLIKNFNSLKFTDSMPVEVIVQEKINHKRLQKQIKSELEIRGAGTKSQLALKLQYEANKTERKNEYKELREVEEDRRFQLRQEKKKKKHKGH